MDIYEIRRLNLASICNQHGRETVVDKIDTWSDTNTLNQILSPKAGTRMGLNLSKKIEAAFEKPTGWISVPHPDSWNESDIKTVEDLEDYELLLAMKAASPDLKKKLKQLLDDET